MASTPLGPDSGGVPESPEGLRFNLGDTSDEPLFFETMRAAEAHQASRHHRTMQAWREMLRARNSPDDRSRGVLALEAYANGSVRDPG